MRKVALTDGQIRFGDCSGWLGKTNITKVQARQERTQTVLVIEIDEIDLSLSLNSGMRSVQMQSFDGNFQGW